ncbi:hypothetical protein M5689_003296 [Euphorbia peplus]|nr:hypothetical protein M5689_003296 [Euphorbia peplus]
MDDDEENLNIDGAPTVEVLSNESSPEHEDPENVMEGARVFAQNIDNEQFMDDVLLGQGRSSERNRNASEVMDRMTHLYATPYASYDPNAAENVQFSAPEDAPTSTPEQVIESHEHNSPEHEDPENVLEGARVFAQTVDNERFMDDVLLGHGRSFERNKNASEVIDRMAHLYATPYAFYDPNAAENVQFSAPEDAPTSTPEQVIESPEHNSPPPPPHTSASDEP